MRRFFISLYLESENRSAPKKQSLPGWFGVRIQPYDKQREGSGLGAARLTTIPSRRRSGKIVNADARFHYATSRSDVDSHIIPTSFCESEDGSLLGSRCREGVVGTRYAANISVTDPELYELSESKEVDRD
jgi:hypothetical protein